MTPKPKCIGELTREKRNAQSDLLSARFSGSKREVSYYKARLSEAHERLEAELTNPRYSLSEDAVLGRLSLYRPNAPYP